MAEHPILFSAPMIRALLAGSKTQTRRVVKWKSPAPGLNLSFSGLSTQRLESVAGPVWSLTSRRGDGAWEERSAPTLCPYGQPGDRLRVKESAWMWCERRPNGTTKTGRPKWLYVPMQEAPIHYAADRPKKPTSHIVSPNTGNEWGWRLKIGRFLPAWASRITLDLVGIRVERLCAISEADAIAEGCAQPACGPDWKLTKRWAYQQLWESINGAGSWGRNDWVWAVSFKRVKP